MNNEDREISDLNWQIRRLENDLSKLKEVLESKHKDKLLNNLEVGNYYEITTNEWSDNYQKYYICKYTGKNIYIKKDCGSPSVFFGGPVIIKSKEGIRDEYEYDKLGSKHIKWKISYKLSNNEKESLYNDNLHITKIDINEVKKSIRKIVNDFK